MLKYIIIGVIFIYFVVVIYRKIANIKKGNFCDCSCSDCHIKDKCNSKGDN